MVQLSIGFLSSALGTSAILPARENCPTEVTSSRLRRMIVKSGELSILYLEELVMDTGLAKRLL